MVRLKVALDVVKKELRTCLLHVGHFTPALEMERTCLLHVGHITPMVGLKLRPLRRKVAGRDHDVTLHHALLEKFGWISRNDDAIAKLYVTKSLVK